MATLDSLDDRFDLTTSSVDIAGRRLQLLHPQSVDHLIDEHDFDRDERLPYWAATWPSARVLAERIARHAGQGRRLLELGCGVGLVSLAAALAGFEVLATDYYAEALEFTAANAARHHLNSIRTREVDWRRFPADLRSFDYVVASDVLYERPYAALIAAALDQSLAAHGVALVTDPGRRVAESFAAECRARGLFCECVDLEQTVDGTTECVVEVFEIRRLGA